MARSVVFDVETTGLEPERGHKIIEIAAIELIDDLPTGDEFHVYVDPMRDIPADATRIHGITMDKIEAEAAPVFAYVANDLMDYFSDSLLIAHNAKFDIGFLDFELRAIGRDWLPGKRSARVVDTLDLAREKFGVGGHTLDALCKRFGIDTSVRQKHNALLDCRLLAAVYLQLLGGAQRGLEIPAAPTLPAIVLFGPQPQRQPRVMQLSEEAAEAHRSFCERMAAKLWGNP
jgi:DNA polymerase III subunit epsilon